MGTSGNPSKKAATKKTSSAKDFKKKREGVIVELPSGLAVRARRVELRSLVSHGSIPNPLMEVVSEALDKGQAMDPQAMMAKDATKDTISLEMIQDMYNMVEAVAVNSFVEPALHPLPEDGVERDDDLLYVDEVEDEDKMFIFQWASGGTDDVAKFREEARASMASLESS